MKSMVEHMTTMIIMMVLIFVFTVIITTGLQIVNARLIHTNAIERMQSSFYNVPVSDLNAELDEGWYFEVNELSSVNTRRDYEVTLNYIIRMPLFSEGGVYGRIVGYAR